MVGIFPMRAKMDHRLKSLGYREVETLAESLLGPAGIRVRGHEFHYSHMQDVTADQTCIYGLRDRKAVSGHREGFCENAYWVPMCIFTGAPIRRRPRILWIIAADTVNPG